jgi:hypothetical protein
MLRGSHGKKFTVRMSAHHCLARDLPDWKRKRPGAPTGLIFPSSWAAKEAERLYGVSPHNVLVQPMGANWFPDTSMSSENLRKRLDARPLDKLDLLYVGKDWERKGGPLALEVVR